MKKKTQQHHETKRRRKRNKTRRKLLTDQHQDDHVHWQRTSISQAQQITNNRSLPTYQSQITPSEEKQQL